MQGTRGSLSWARGQTIEIGTGGSGSGGSSTWEEVFGEPNVRCPAPS